MSLLVELTNAKTGAQRTLYDETVDAFPGTYRDVLEPHFYFGTIIVAAYRARPDTKRQVFFDVFVSQCGGTWREVRGGVWLHVERN